MGTSYAIGHPRLRLLDATGATLKTLHLPPPDNHASSLQWKEKLHRAELVDGSERVRRLGFIPVLKLKWSVYDDRPGRWRYPVGAADGNLASFGALLSLLDAPQGRLKVSPGPTSGGFVGLVTANITEIPVMGVMAMNVELEFTGRDILPARTLGAFL